MRMGFVVRRRCEGRVVRPLGFFRDRETLLRNDIWRICGLGKLARDAI